MTKRFLIDIGFDDEGEMYHANVYSAGDNKGACVKNASMRRLMARVTKLVRDKNSEIKHFPIAEPRLILAPGQNGDINLVVPADN